MLEATKLLLEDIKSRKDREQMFSLTEDYSFADILMKDMNLGDDKHG